MTLELAGPKLDLDNFCFPDNPYLLNLLLRGWSFTPFGPYPQYGWDFPEEIPEKFRKDPGNALRAFPGISLESTAGMAQTL